MKNIQLIVALLLAHQAVILASLFDDIGDLFGDFGKRIATLVDPEKKVDSPPLEAKPKKVDPISPSTGKRKPPGFFMHKKDGEEPAKVSPGPAKEPSQADLVAAPGNLKPISPRMELFEAPLGGKAALVHDDLAGLLDPLVPIEPIQKHTKSIVDAKEENIKNDKTLEELVDALLADNADGKKENMLNIDDDDVLAGFLAGLGDVPGPKASPSFDETFASLHGNGVVRKGLEDWDGMMAELSEFGKAPPSEEPLSDIDASIAGLGDEPEPVEAKTIERLKPVKPADLDLANLLEEIAADEEAEKAARREKAAFKAVAAPKKAVEPIAKKKAKVQITKKIVVPEVLDEEWDNDEYNPFAEEERQPAAVAAPPVKVVGRAAPPKVDKSTRSEIINPGEPHSEVVQSYLDGNIQDFFAKVKVADYEDVLACARDAGTTQSMNLFESMASTESILKLDKGRSPGDRKEDLEQLGIALDKRSIQHLKAFDYLLNGVFDELDRYLDKHGDCFLIRSMSFNVLTSALRNPNNQDAQAHLVAYKEHLKGKGKTYLLGHLEELENPQLTSKRQVQDNLMAKGEYDVAWYMLTKDKVIPRTEARLNELVSKISKNVFCRTCEEAKKAENTDLNAICKKRHELC